MYEIYYAKELNHIPRIEKKEMKLVYNFKTVKISMSENNCR